MLHLLWGIFLRLNSIGKCFFVHLKLSVLLSFSLPFVDTMLLKPSGVVCYVVRVYMKYGYVYHGGPQSSSLLSDIWVALGSWSYFFSMLLRYLSAVLYLIADNFTAKNATFVATYPASLVNTIMYLSSLRTLLLCQDETRIGLLCLFFPIRAVVPSPPRTTSWPSMFPFKVHPCYAATV